MKIFTFLLAAILPCFVFSLEAEACETHPNATIPIKYTYARILNIWQCSKCGTINSGFDTHCSACGTPRNGEEEETGEEE